MICQPSLAYGLVFNLDIYISAIENFLTRAPSVKKFVTWLTISEQSLSQQENSDGGRAVGVVGGVMALCEDCQLCGRINRQLVTLNQP